MMSGGSSLRWAWVAAAVFVLYACGGGDDDSSAKRDSGSNGGNVEPDAGGGASGSGGSSGTGGSGGRGGSGGHSGNGAGGASAHDAGAAHDAGNKDAGDASADEDSGAPDMCPDDPDKTEPGVCGCGMVDDPTDSDADNTPDCADGCPTDLYKTEPGNCGCGAGENAGNDTDSDGTNDCADHCYLDPAKIAPGVCGCGNADDDSDSDGTEDCHDLCPYNMNKVAPGVCGCFVADADGDGDTVMDCVDNCPAIANPTQTDADNDGVGAMCDCHDDDARVNAGHLELCDTIDNDCDTSVDEGDPDGDGVAGCNCAWQTGTFSWRDITSSGTKITALNAEDDNAVSIPIGFAFAFSGASYTTLLVSTNGFLVLGSNSISAASSSANQSLPDPNAPNGVIAPFWDDLVNDGNGIFYAVSGAMPNRELVVSWETVKLFDEPTTRVAFQAVLHEGGGIEFQYDSATLASGAATGNHATVGIEHVSGQQALPRGFDQAVVTYPLNLIRVCN